MNEPVQTMANGVRVITPRHILREKIGYGGIDPVALEKAEEIIQKPQIDFIPYGKTFLEKIEDALQAAKTVPEAERNRDIIHAIIRPVMELKASGGMFGHPLVSEIADIVLDFLENIELMNEDAIGIVDVHHRTLTALVVSGQKGDGGKAGLALSKELYAACQRYRKKYPAAEKPDKG